MAEPAGSPRTAAGRVAGGLRAMGVALAVLLVAGCIHPASQPAAAPAPVAPPAPPRTLDWTQKGCSAVTWSVPVLATSLQPYLPPGFEPASDGPSGLGGAATLGFRTVECAAGFGQTILLRSSQWGMLFTPVVPPPGLREDRFGTRYTYGWDVLVAPDGWRSAAAAWGMPLRDGGAMVGLGAEGWTGDLAMDRTGTFSVTGHADSLRPAAGAESRMITAGAHGFALWDSETTDLQQAAGAGVWSASPESWAAKLLGQTQGAATFEHSTFDLEHAVVHWPGDSAGPMDPGSGPSGYAVAVAPSQHLLG